MALLVLTGALLAITGVGWLLAMALESTFFVHSFAVDYGIYMDAVDRVLGGGSWYQVRQLHGSYPIELGDVLYPPILLYLLVPFRLLGPYLWVLVPSVIVVGTVVRHRPALWAWFLIAICLAWPVTPAKYLFGNPVIWGSAAVALGTVFSWPAALLIVKPTVIPFALIGIRDRRWWLALVALAVISIPFLADTLTYPQVLLNAQTNPVDGRGGPLYSLQEYPLLLIPVLAWLGRHGRSWRVTIPMVRRPRRASPIPEPPESLRRPTD